MISKNFAWELKKCWGGKKKCTIKSVLNYSQASYPVGTGRLWMSVLSSHLYTLSVVAVYLGTPALHQSRSGCQTHDPGQGAGLRHNHLILYRSWEMLNNVSTKGSQLQSLRQQPKMDKVSSNIMGKSATEERRGTEPFLEKRKMQFFLYFLLFFPMLQ